MTDLERIENLISHNERLSKENQRMSAKIQELELNIMHLEDGTQNPELERDIELLKEHQEKLITDNDVLQHRLEQYGKRDACLKAVRKVLEAIPDNQCSPEEIALKVMIEDWPE